MRGRSQAILVAAVSLFLFPLPPLNIISAAAVALVTLRQGQRDGLVTMFGAGIALTIVGIIFAVPGVVIVYALLFSFSVWIFSVLLRESGRLAVTFEVALSLGLLVVFAVYLIQSDPPSMWREKMQLVLNPLIKNPPPGIEIEPIETAIQIGVHYMTGVVVAGSVVALVAALLLGRWWQSVLFNPGGFRKEFLSLKADAIIGYAFLLILVLPGLSSGLFRESLLNAGILGFSFYLIVGISVLHALLAATSAGPILIPVMYILLLFVPYVLFAVALLGFSDSWANWRSRVAVK